MLYWFIDIPTLCTLSAQVYERMHHPRGPGPNPNHPSEYCSTVPPLQQAQANLNSPPLTVMVPTQGALRRGGKKKSQKRWKQEFRHSRKEAAGKPRFLTALVCTVYVEFVSTQS